MKFLNLLVAILLPAVCVPGQAKKSDIISNTIEQSNNKSDIELRQETIVASIDTLMTLKDKFKEQIEQPIQKTLGMLRDLLKKPKDIALGYLKKFENQLQEKTMAFIESVSKTDDDSSNLGTDITNCIENYINEFSDMSKRILHVVTKCITDKKQESEDIILGTINNVISNHVKAQAVWRELEDCKNSTINQKTIICVNSITVKIQSFLVEIPVELTKAATKVKDYTPEVVSAYLADCTDGNEADVGFHGPKLAANIALCTGSKLLNSSKVTTTETEIPRVKSEDKTLEENLSLGKKLTEEHLESSDQENKTNTNGTDSVNDEFYFATYNGSQARIYKIPSGKRKKKRWYAGDGCEGGSPRVSSSIYFIYLVSVNIFSFICVQFK